MKKYIAKIGPLNAEKIACSPHGTATFTEDEEQDTLHIMIEMFDTPANIEHWQHFHGFPDGKDAHVATMDNDLNGDGFIDLPETEPVSGTTMVPFNKNPEKINIPTDSYPHADESGHYLYEADVPLNELKKHFKEIFNTTDLALDKRVVYIHGVPESLSLPNTVQGSVAKYGPHVTLPIAVGKIEKVN
ncbi:hypothetical protein [Lactobacillus taiwanensis]|uniref:hypothetical protein n=1 Tax=Lactobacillus taiwanensis TaxID=508451 RepID=UPI001AEC2B0E|nr:hypothetical protein [Lactobacillus taiwanensis]QTQ40395.1 hypothetical protein H1A07_02600 [Lactobacillus taiwanensis]